MWLIIIIGLIVLHALVFFVLSRLFVPFLGFSKEPLPKSVPKQMQDDINKLKGKSGSKEEYANDAAYQSKDSKPP